MLIIAVGALLALVMAGLGLWQMSVFQRQGAETVASRTTQPAVPLLDHLGDDAQLGALYGAPVSVDGRYLADQQIVIPTEGRYRILTALELADGRVIPVVRGLTNTATPGQPPTGDQQVVGVFLPGEGEQPGAAGDQLGSVRMPQVAQRWPQPLLPGFVTLDPTHAAQNGLDPASVTLPSGEGSAQNKGYALQWWVFAAFALGVSIKIARDLDKRDEDAAEAARAGDSVPDVSAD